MAFYAQLQLSNYYCENKEQKKNAKNAGQYSESNYLLAQIVRSMIAEKIKKYFSVFSDVVLMFVD